jgi:ComF family protein
VPLERDVRACPHCPPGVVAASRSAFLFAGSARQAVHRLKYRGWRPVAAALGRSMARAMRADRSLPAADVVTWVPLSRSRLAERGFDQARVLADVVARELGLASVRLLERTADAGPQALRGGVERREAMPGLFEPRREAPPTVLLVDDVLTTGATAAACAEALRQAGATRVLVLTAARAVSAPMPGRYTRLGWSPGSVVAPGGGPPGSRC